MDLDEPEQRGFALSQDESSGSAFEISDNESSHDENGEVLPASKAGSDRGTGRSVTKKTGNKGRRAASVSDQGAGVSSMKEIIEDAAQWAANFIEPKLEDIKTPQRLSRGGKKRKPRKPPKSATETRVKRLKSFYSNDYRELLNSEIQEAAAKVANIGRLSGSQIGSSIWTAEEKAITFAALERLGRDDVRGIAERITSKSQHEVQEYINLLNQGATEKKQNYYQLTTPADLPSAVEVSDECAAVLERAGDSLAAHQEVAEVKGEQAKWGDSWLINEDVALQMAKRRRQESGEEEMEEVFPAANLLDLSNWIELSERIFMNPGAPHEEDNWQTVAESGESPAVRATAFEDFHSLAYNITKRLVSTALFCTMSRLRARGFNKAKHAEVKSDDVEAAVNILGLKADSHDFWRGVAKRGSLQVINDDNDEEVPMTYKDVEKALQERRPRMRSRSVSRARSRARSEQPELSTTYANQIEDIESSPPDIEQEDSESSSESEYISLPNSDEEYMSSPPPESISSSSASSPRPSNPQETLPDAQEVAEAALDSHTEACDMYTSQTEEMRLWNLLKQAPPFEFNLIPVLDEAPKHVGDDLAERENWRIHVDYVNEWEDVDMPIADEAFARNRRRISRLARRREGRVEAGVDADLDIEADIDGDVDDRDKDINHHEDEDGSTDDQAAKGSGQEIDLAAIEEPEDQDVDVVEGVDDELLRVESPRHQSPRSQSPDQEL